MSMPDKATYILYGVVYITLGVWVLRGFIKITRSSKNFLKLNPKESKESSGGNRTN